MSGSLKSLFLRTLRASDKVSRAFNGGFGLMLSEGLTGHNGGTMDGLEGKSGATGPRPFSDEATGKITHLNSTEIKVEQHVGPTTPFLTIDAATLTVDEQGKPTNVNSTDLVTVNFLSLIHS